ncbi:DUF4252 domain-containing protein [Gramella sp. KN1008]|uniref:DUF4252 domain-containing protein n=1 Tax=Gramella sp. KN1008 TaxID=2529298 RepID=UPI00103D6E1C|nr:DUF4252 domain-containing protein [Gramella sp. KN1008]TBW29009.1 DUF4252 domain-containing protein [Gramella sp. KN1008]
MKRIIIIFLIGFSPVMNFAQNFAKYEELSGVDMFTVSPQAFKMANKIELGDDPESLAYKKLIDGLEQIEIYKTSKPEIRKMMSNDVNSYLGKKPFSELMSVKESGNTIKFYFVAGSTDNYVKELLMFLEGEEDGEPISLIFNIKGNINLSQLYKLAEDLKVPGAEELKKANKKS